MQGRLGHLLRWHQRGNLWVRQNCTFLLFWGFVHYRICRFQYTLPNWLPVWQWSKEHYFPCRGLWSTSCSCLSNKIIPSEQSSAKMQNLALLDSIALQTSCTPFANTPWCKADITNLFIVYSWSDILDLDLIFTKNYNLYFSLL